MYTHSYTRIVEFGDCDPARIVWNPRYFAFADHGMTLLFTEALKMPLPEAFARYGIAGLPLVQTDGEFPRSATFGDELTIQTTVDRLGRSSIRLRHKVLVAGETCAEIVGVRVWSVTVPGHPGRIMSAAIPDEVRAILCG